MPPKYIRKPCPHITAQLLELIAVGATTRIAICALLEISMDQLRARLADNLWKAYQVDILVRTYKLIHQPDPE